MTSSNPVFSHFCFICELAPKVPRSLLATAKLEEAYQQSKRLKSERDALQAQVSRYQKPALEEAHERFGTKTAATPAKPAATGAGAWTSVLPHGMKYPEKQRDGMQIRHPDFWKSMTEKNGSGGLGSKGMGWFQEPRLVGKEYQDGRKPKSIVSSAV